MIPQKPFLNLGLAMALTGASAFSQSGDSLAVDSAKARFDALEQKVLILERLREVDQEEAKAAKAKVGKALADAKGFGLTSQDDEFQLKFKGFLQTVATVYADDGDKKLYTDNITARRVQTSFDGLLYKQFALRVQTDFAGATFVLLDSYLDWLIDPAFNIRIGKFKVPTNLERLQSPSRVQFVEQGLPSGLLPNRDLGFQFFGNLGDGLLEYQIGLFNGVQDGGSGIDDANDDKDAVGRVFLAPFANSSLFALQGLGLGASASRGYQQKGVLPVYRTPSRKTFFSYLAADTLQGAVTRLAPQASYYNGPLALNGEWVSSTQKLRKTGVAPEEFTHTAWQATASWLITGETNSYKGIKVNKGITDSGFGAIEILGRVNGLRIDEDTFEKNTWADSTKSAKEALGWAVGVNWHLNNAVRWVLNYEQTTFKGGKPKDGNLDAEKVVSLSFNVAY